MKLHLEKIKLLKERDLENLESEGAMTPYCPEPPTTLALVPTHREEVEKGAPGFFVKRHALDTPEEQAADARKHAPNPNPNPHQMISLVQPKSLNKAKP